MANPDTRPLAVVTGASSGIGYELASLFSEVGFDLVVAADLRLIDLNVRSTVHLAKRVVAGSRRNKLHAAAGKPLPETVSARMHGQMPQPGSAP
jgi:NAD(P)-dependent dehydrogenase (short-subunit alcohol dehydrogenase family)